MKLRNHRRPMATTAVAALTFGMITLAGTADALAAPVTETKTINHECTVWSNAWGGANMNATVNPDNVSVTYPQEVHAGETFDVTIQPGAMRAGSESMGRVKYDIALPTGVDVSNIRLDGDSFGSGGPATIVERVNTNGDPDPAGQYARISGDGNTVNNGPKPGNNQPKDGLTVASETDFRLPGVSFTVTAPDTVGATITAGLRGAGVPKGPAGDDNIENTISFMEQGRVWHDAIFCNADEAGRALTSTEVIAAADTTVSAEAPTGVKPMVEAPTTVTVSPATAGTVTATVEGQAITADVDPTTGNATLPLVFPREGRYSVPIEFTPANPRAAKPSSTTVDVTVAAPSYDSVSIALTNEPEGKTGEKHLFRADVTPNIGNASNVTGFLTLAVNGDKLMKDGAEVRVPVTGGTANFDLTWSNPGEKAIEATFIGAEGQAMGSASTTVTIVDENGEVPPGDDGEDEPPTVGGDLPSDPGSSGSSDITSFFERLWQFIVDLFTGQLPGSAGSSDRPATDDAVPATTN